MSSAKHLAKSLPEDLILEVFLRLPWKSFLHCRSVSKRFCDLIDCPLFLKRYDIFHNYVSDIAVMYIEADRLLSIDFNLRDSPNPPKEREIGILNNKKPIFVGCCKGIVCLMVAQAPESYMLLNPFNGTFQNVERSNPNSLNIEFYSIGFGYDSATDDYKIMRMERVTKGNLQSTIDVYSMKVDSWKQINGVFSKGSFAHFNGICVEGALHWLWLNDVNSYSCVAAFDLKTDFLRILKLPPHYQNQNLSLNDFGGRLSVLVKSSNCNTYIVWVIEEYGADQTSWTEMLNIRDHFNHICYFPMRDMEEFVFFGPNLGLKKGEAWFAITQGSFRYIQIPKRSCYATQSWVCVRSSFRLRHSLSQIA